MRLRLNWGRHEQDFDVADGNLVEARPAPNGPALADPTQATRDALERPLDYPPLRRSLTPGDHVAVVVDEGLPGLARYLVPVLEQVTSAGVTPDAITLLCRPPSGTQAWVDDLPDLFQDVRIEVHQPEDRKRLSYLAATKQGRRVYLARTAVDADQLVILARRQYDPLRGHVGGETALFPDLGDDATRNALAAPRTSDRPHALQAEATEIAWLLGAPFLVHVIEGDGATASEMLTGPTASVPEAIRRYESRWKVAADRTADVVLAPLLGDPNRITSEEIALAFYNAAHAARPGGSAVVLTDAAPNLGRAFEIIRQQDEPGDALKFLAKERPDDFRAGYFWEHAARRAKLYLLSGLPAETVEDLHAVPLEQARQVQRLLTAGASVLVLPDAHKAMIPPSE